MSPPEVWGPAVWTLFHTLIEKLNEEAYPFIKTQLFNQIKRICRFLPCPDCADDATKILATININDLKTKVDFKNTFYLFHNKVNAKKRKPLYNYSNLSIYKKYNIVPVINNFISKYNTKGNMKLIAESFQRSIIIKEFTQWIRGCCIAFSSPKNVPLPVSKTEEESTNTTENAVIITEEVAIADKVVITKEEVVTTKEEVVTKEEVFTKEEVITKDIVTKEVASEEVVVTKEEVVVNNKSSAVE